MNGKKKFFYAFFVCLVTLAIVVLIFISIGSTTELNRLKQGAREGFEISGTYMKTGPTGYFISFIENKEDKDQIIWQFQENNSISASGYIEEALGPNVYVLFSHEGAEVGWVNLAYTNNNDEVFLFVKFNNEEVIELSRYSKVPMINSESS